MDVWAEGASCRGSRKDRRIDLAFEASTKLGRIGDDLLVGTVEQLDTLDRAIGAERHDGRAGDIPGLEFPFPLEAGSRSHTRLMGETDGVVHGARRFEELPYRGGTDNRLACDRCVEDDIDRERGRKRCLGWTPDDLKPGATGCRVARHPSRVCHCKKLLRNRKQDGRAASCATGRREMEWRIVGLSVPVAGIGG